MCLHGDSFNRKKLTITTSFQHFANNIALIAIEESIETTTSQIKII